MGLRKKSRSFGGSFPKQANVLRGLDDPVRGRVRCVVCQQDMDFASLRSRVRERTVLPGLEKTPVAFRTFCCVLRKCSFDFSQTVENMLFQAAFQALW